MRKHIGVLSAVIIIILFAGCSSARFAKLEENDNIQKKKIDEMLKNIDQYSISVNKASSEITQINLRLNELEKKLETVAGQPDTSLQDLRDNISFLSEQLSRVDKSLQAEKPKPAAKTPANVFKPGGFNVNSAYTTALSDYNSKKYDSAISGFKEILTVAPNSSLADNAQYWIGECYDAMGQLDNAIAAFNKIFDYPKSNKTADAHLKMGVIYVKMNKKDLAKEEFSSVISSFPGTTAAETASAKLKALGQ